MSKFFCHPPGGVQKLLTPHGCQPPWLPPPQPVINEWSLSEIYHECYHTYTRVLLHERPIFDMKEAFIKQQQHVTLDDILYIYMLRLLFNPLHLKGTIICIKYTIKKDKIKIYL